MITILLEMLANKTQTVEPLNFDPRFLLQNLKFVLELSIEIALKLRGVETTEFAR